MNLEQTPKTMRIATLVYVLMLFVFARCAWAQETPAQLVDRALPVYGNALISGEIQDWIAEGKLTYFTMKGPKATFDVILLRRGKTKVQRIIKQPTAELRQGSDGTKSWDSLNGWFVSTARGRSLYFIESQTLRSIQTLFNYRTQGLTQCNDAASSQNRVAET